MKQWRVVSATDRYAILETSDNGELVEEDYLFFDSDGFVLLYNERPAGPARVLVKKVRS